MELRALLGMCYMRGLLGANLIKAEVFLLEDYCSVVDPGSDPTETFLLCPDLELKLCILVQGYVINYLFPNISKTYVFVFFYFLNAR
jgi:hypothetical protein